MECYLFLILRIPFLQCTKYKLYLSLNFEVLPEFCAVIVVLKDSIPKGPWLSSASKCLHEKCEQYIWRLTRRSNTSAIKNITYNGVYASLNIYA